MSTADWEPPSPGELQHLLPQYEITGILGLGGMGAVYKGRQTKLNRTARRNSRRTRRPSGNLGQRARQDPKRSRRQAATFPPSTRDQADQSPRIRSYKNGFEVQIANDHSDPSKTGTLWGVSDPVNRMPARDGEWFELRMVVSGKTVSSSVDGKKLMEWTEPDDWTPPNGKPEPRIGRGTIGLQANGGVTWIKDMVLKCPVVEADPSPAAAKPGPPATPDPERIRPDPKLSREAAEYALNLGAFLGLGVNGTELKIPAGGPLRDGTFELWRVSFPTTKGVIKDKDVEAITQARELRFFSTGDQRVPQEITNLRLFRNTPPVGRPGPLWLRRPL